MPGAHEEAPDRRRRRPAAGIALVALVGFLRFNFTNGGDDLHDARGPGPSADVKNLAITIDHQTFTMSNGLAAREAAPGSATQNTVRIIGEPVWGDADRDGHLDAALLIENDPGGSGTFYYAVLAFNDSGRYRATNALLLGDRIAPQTVDFLDGRFVYNYAARGPGEPMTARPSVQKTLWIRFDKASRIISVDS